MFVVVMTSVSLAMFTEGKDTHLGREWQWISHAWIDVSVDNIDKPWRQSAFLCHKSHPTNIYDSYVLAFPLISTEVSWPPCFLHSVLIGIVLSFQKRVFWHFINPTCPRSSHINIFVIWKRTELFMTLQHPRLFPFWHAFMLNLKI